MGDPCVFVDSFLSQQNKKQYNGAIHIAYERQSQQMEEIWAGYGPRIRFQKGELPGFKIATTTISLLYSQLYCKGFRVPGN
jgi:hypothetical protein